MIRTLIEVTAETDSELRRNLRETLDKLGYEEKPDARWVKWREDLYRALDAKGLKPQELVDEYRKSIGLDEYL